MNSERKTIVSSRFFVWIGGGMAGLLLLALCGAAAFYTVQYSNQYGSAGPAGPARVVISALPQGGVPDPTWQTFASGESVRDVIAAHGFWWIATDGGLVVINPESSELVHLTVDQGLPGNRLTALVEDRQGVIWIGTQSAGMVRYDGRSWEQVTTADGLPGSDIDQIIVDTDGVLWAVAGGQLIRYDGSRWRAIRFNFTDVLPPMVNDVAAGPSGVWAATPDGVWWFNGESWRLFSVRDGLINSQVETIAAGTDGTVWAVTPAGIGRYSSSGWSRITVRDGLLDYPIGVVVPRADGTAWIGYASAEAGEFGFYDGLVTHQSLPDSLQGPVQHAHGDRDGLWWGTGSGMARYVSNQWQTIALPDAIPNRITDFVESGGRFWATSPEGIFEIDGNSWTSVVEFPATSLSAIDNSVVAAGITPSDGLNILDGETGRWEFLPCRTAGPRTSRVSAGNVGPNGWVWLASDRGAMGYDGVTWHHFEEGWPGDFMARALVVDQNNRVWVGLEEGLFRLDPDVGRWERVLNENIFRLAVDPEGLVWFLSANGLAHLVEGRPVFIPYPALEAPSLGFEATEEGLWISGRGGVGRFNNGGWRVYSISDGLASDDVTTLAVDEGGRIYAGYGHARLGFSVFEDGRWRTIHNIKNPEAENGGHGGSLIPRREAVTALGILPGQQVWFGTQFGDVGSVGPDQLLYEPDDFRLVWNDVRVITVDQADSVWIVDFEGRIARHWPAEDRWEQYDTALAEAQVTAVVTTDSGNWLGTDQGIVEFENDRCHFVPFRDDLSVVDGVYEPGADRIWWATSNGGAIALDTKSGDVAWDELSLRGMPLIDAASDGQGRLWFLSPNELVQYFGGEVLKIDQAVNEGKILPVAIAVDPGGQPLIAGATGVYTLGRNGWEPFEFLSGLADPVVYHIEVTKAGEIWFFTAGGVSVYSPSR